MTIPYVTFMKHAEKVAKATPASRPILQGVHHAENGDLVVTDSHRLYLAKEAQTSNDGAVIHPKTGASIEGNYPDVSRLIPDNDPKFSVEINVIEALKAVKSLKGCAQVTKLELAKMSVTGEGKVYISVDSPVIEAKYSAGYATVEWDAETVAFNIQYLVDALELFKDAGLTEVTFNSFGPMRPFTLKQNDDLLALILPIRTY